ncbi:glycosyltransferase family 9 protein [Psychromonas sp. CD1]|uniref:glycosyltransferase family 9 protein n=1 Tax=Psychromonas sp. CD1 TaxID=1979839 RepID=UPI000B9AD206|nr:glycosyltransferase family 9 protein [Psychromonas sp. CD1]
MKIGFDKERANDGQWLFTNTKIAQSSSPHVLDGFMSFITKLGIKDIEPRWKINIPSEVLERTQNIINNKKTFIICPATSKTYKNWTREGYCTLAQHALKKGFQVLICGANTEIEHDFANYIVQKTQKKAITLIAKTSLIELLALIQKSNLILAPDTGAIHMTTMVGTPVIGLYAHHNPQRTGPYHAQENVVSVYEYFICKETHKNIKQLSWRARVKNKHAMQKIPEKSVIDLFNKITFKLI